MVLALAGYWYIADWPSKAKFITSDERTFIHNRLKADSDATENEAFTWANVASALKDPKVWLYCFNYHTLSLPLYTLSLFLVSCQNLAFRRASTLTTPSQPSSKPLDSPPLEPNFSPFHHTL